jgi:hypothetical protein
MHLAWIPRADFDVIHPTVRFPKDTRARDDRDIEELIKGDPSDFIARERTKSFDLKRYANHKLDRPHLPLQNLSSIQIPFGL